MTALERREGRPTPKAAPPGRNQSDHSGSSVRLAADGIESIPAHTRIPGQSPRPVNLARVLFAAVEDAWREAEAINWERRAAIFEKARPQPGDFNGNATVDELAERDRRCAETAQACRNKADAVRRGWDH